MQLSETFYFIPEQVLDSIIESAAHGRDSFPKEKDYELNCLSRTNCASMKVRCFLESGEIKSFKINLGIN